jgi:6-phosphogluconolactonase
MAESPGSVQLHASEDPESKAGDELAAAMARVLAKRESVRLAIPGGSAIEALPATRDRLGADWSRVLLTWVDERCVPADDPDSNFGAARHLGLLENPSPARVLALYEEGESPIEAVSRVSRQLSEYFEGALDVLLLGMGEDGHIASLFPSRPEPTEGLVAYVSDSPKPPLERITLTRAILEAAEATILLATGEIKRAAVEGLIAADTRLPAFGLPGLVLVTDLEVSE